MGKKKVAAPEAPKEEPKKAAKSKAVGEIAKERASRAQLDKFEFLRQPNAEKEEKLAPQAQCIVNTIAANKKGVARKDLVEQLAPVLTTKQPAARILAYYQKELVNEGYIRLTKNEKQEEAAA